MNHRRHGSDVLTYSVVVATKDRPELIASVVQTVLDQTRPSERIVIVDASSHPLELAQSLDALARQKGVDLVLRHSRPSTSAQRNLGVESIDTPLVLFLDDDVTLEPAYMDALLSRWERAGLEGFGAMVGSPQTVRPQSPVGGLMRRALQLHYYDHRGSATRLRRSRKLALVVDPADDVQIPAVGAGGAVFRTDLLRRHRFDERFAGYAPGEDLDMSYRLSREAPIVQTPAVKFLHAWDPRERESPSRWRLRGQREAYFRMRHVGRSPLDRAAFAVSVGAETLQALLDSLRERDSTHLKGYAGGLREAARAHREDRPADGLG